MSVLTPGAKIVSTPPLAFFIYDDIFAILKRTPLYFLESRFLHEY
jgi:hypothetical protein